MQPFLPLILSITGLVGKADAFPGGVPDIDENGYVELPPRVVNHSFVAKPPRALFAPLSDPSSPCNRSTKARRADN